MKVVGLTGSIGMGKSALAKRLRKKNIPVHEADEAVHRLLGRGGAAVAAIKKRFPACVKAGAVDRAALGAVVFRDAHARRDLEKILHPLVRADSSRFLKLCRRKGRKIAVLDIPLLFETRQQKRCHHVICVTAPQFVQKRRVLSRQGMTESRLRAVLELQMPDAIKRRRADTVINTARGYGPVLMAATKTIRRLARAKGTVKGDARKP